MLHKHIWELHWKPACKFKFFQCNKDIDIMIFKHANESTWQMKVHGFQTCWSAMIPTDNSQVFKILCL